MGLRLQKVVSALKREISNILHNDIKDNRLGFVTIMRVDVSPDLRCAHVYYSVLGGEKQKKDTDHALERAKSYIRCLIAERMKLRFVPELIFKLDHSIEDAIRIEQVFEEIKQESGQKKNKDG